MIQVIFGDRFEAGIRALGLVAFLSLFVFSTQALAAYNPPEDSTPPPSSERSEQLGSSR